MCMSIHLVCVRRLGQETFSQRRGQHDPHVLLTTVVVATPMDEVVHELGFDEQTDTCDNFNFSDSTSIPATTHTTSSF